MISIITNPTTRIPYLRPHYTDFRFKSPQTVYLAQGYTIDPETGYVKGAGYNYSDRYLSWYSYEAIELAHMVAKDKAFEYESALYHEVYLRELTDDPGLKLVHIMAGFNVSNGYPYQVYGIIADKGAK